MATEIEAKLRVTSHDPVRAALAEIGAEPVGSVLETNHILDGADGSLHARGAALRVRASRPLGGGPERVTLTYKGAVEPGRLKRRQEIEVGVAAAAELLELLQHLGYVQVLEFEKRRDSFRLGGCRVELDRLPRLGCFVEIEGPDEEAVRQAQLRVGLGHLAHIPASYVSLLIDHGERTGSGRCVRFTGRESV